MLIGSILLIIPGIIAYVAFIFVFLYVAVDDENVIAALSDSWGLTRGSWIRLFVLLFIVFVGVGVISGLFTVISAAIVGAGSGPAVSTFVSGVITLPFSLLTLGILADAFTQLRESHADAPSP